MFACLFIGAVAKCKRKWQNLRDAYRALVRRSECRIMKDKARGVYDPNNTDRYESKWSHYQALSFIRNNRRRKRSAFELLSKDYDANTNSSNEDGSDSQLNCGMEIKVDPYIISDGDHYSIDDDDDDDDDDNDGTDNEQLFLEELQNSPTIQQMPRQIMLGNIPVSLKPCSELEALCRQIPANISVTVLPEAENSKNPQPSSCITHSTYNHGYKENDILTSSAERSEKRIDFLELLEKEEQKLMRSTQKDEQRSTTDHSGDPDYNFLISFLPQMKKMNDLQNLQFRTRMSELVLNILAPSLAAPTYQPPPLTAGPVFRRQQLQSSVVQGRTMERPSNTVTINAATSTSCIFIP